MCLGELMKSNLYIKRDIDIINKSISLEHTNDFWHLRSGSSLELTCLDTKRIYSNEEELTKDFISLEDYLKESIPLGYQFQRTKPIIDIDGDKDYKYTRFNGYNEYIALYNYDGIILAYQVNPYFDDYNYYEESGYHKYTIIPAFYVKDGNYSLSGETCYLEKDTTYDEIIKQEQPRAKRRLVLKQD